VTLQLHHFCFGQSHLILQGNRYKAKQNHSLPQSFPPSKTGNRLLQPFTAPNTILPSPADENPVRINPLGKRREQSLHDRNFRAGSGHPGADKRQEELASDPTHNKPCDFTHSRLLQSSQNFLYKVYSTAFDFVTKGRESAGKWRRIGRLNFNSAVIKIGTTDRFPRLCKAHLIPNDYHQFYTCAYQTTRRSQVLRPTNSGRYLSQSSPFAVGNGEVCHFFIPSNLRQ